MTAKKTMPLAALNGSLTQICTYLLLGLNTGPAIPTVEAL